MRPGLQLCLCALAVASCAQSSSSRPQAAAGEMVYGQQNQPAMARTRITIVNRSPYVRGLAVREPVRAECGIEAQIPADIAAHAQKYYDIAWVHHPQGVNGWVLETWVVGLHAPGGGGWSGRKEITVEGRLRYNGQIVGTFVARRSSGGGHRECTLLERCAHTLGSDITEWLFDPRPNALLGELEP